MEKHDVSELRMQQGGARYLLRRGPQGVAAVPMAAPAPIHAAPAHAAPIAAPTPPAADSPASADTGLTPIKSPTVGTFYPSPSPGEPSFVKVGDSVKADTIVCIVEAMKVFNQIPAGVSGTIEKVLLNEGDSVEFGQTLFLVK